MWLWQVQEKEGASFLKKDNTGSYVAKWKPESFFIF